MVDLKYTSVDEIPKIRDTLKDTFRKGVLRPLEWRKQQLLQLARLAQDNADTLAEAISEDMGKPKVETFAVEVAAIIERCLKSAKNLEEWAKPEIVQVPDWQKPWTPTVHKTPKGVVLIISPWNYPMILTLQPLLGAIAAGCCAVVKPSELAPAYAKLIAELLPKYLDQSAYRVVNGAVEETTRLLEFPWDHIFYIGNPRVARIIAAAAAKHLTAVTFELGGKCPVIIDPTTDISLAAKRILWGKCSNAGQICMAPDYVIVPRNKQDEFVAALKTHVDTFFPEGAFNSKFFARIISTAHHNRLKGLLNRTQGQIVFGGNVNNKNGFEPTVVRDVKDGDSLLEEEIFGPILPVIPVDDISEAIEFVNARPHALFVYAFSEDAKVKQRILDNTRSGGIVFNDTFQQAAVSELPLGGMGESGHGYQNMKYTYDEFTHLRGSIDMPKQCEQFLEVRYPPFNNEQFKVLSAGVHVEIPR